MKLTEMFLKQKELRALAAAVASGAEAEKRGLTALEEKRMADIETEIKSLDEAIEKELRSPVNTPNLPNQPQAENRSGIVKLTVRSVIEAMMLDSAEKRAMASGGAETPKFIEQILEAVFESNPMRQIASVFSIKGDDVVPVPGSPTGAWGAEGATINPADIPITPVAFSAFNFNGGVTVNDATMDDDFYDVSKMLSEAIGGYLGEQEATAMFGSGAGADRPQGLFNGGTAVETVGAGAVVLGDFINFINSLETKWRKGKEQLILSPTVLGAIINLKDNTGKIELDQTRQVINGAPYILTSLAPAYSAATGTKLAAFGNMKRAYGVAQRSVDKGTYRTKIVPSGTAFTQNVLFNERVDGRVIDSAAYKVWTVK